MTQELRAIINNIVEALKDAPDDVVREIFAAPWTWETWDSPNYVRPPYTAGSIVKQVLHNREPEPSHVYARALYEEKVRALDSTLDGDAEWLRCPDPIPVPDTDSI